MMGKKEKKAQKKIDNLLKKNKKLSKEVSKMIENLEVSLK